MKKWYVIVMSFCAFNSLFSMEAIPMYGSSSEDELLCKSSQFAFVQRTDWPFLPFTDIKSGIERLPKSSKKKIRQYELPSLLCSVGELPQEIGKLIIFKMLDEDEESTKKFIAMPLVHAFDEYAKNKDRFAKIAHLKNKSLGIFFRLSQEEQDSIIQFYQPTIKADILFGDTAMTEESLKELDNFSEDIHREFFAEEEIVIINSTVDTRLGCNCSKSLIPLTSVLLVCAEAGLAGILLGVGVSESIVFGVWGAELGVTGLIMGYCWCRKFKNSAQIKRL